MRWGQRWRERDSASSQETSSDDRGSQSRGGRGGTQLYDAIFLASDELMKPKDGRKALVVFSDGEDRGSKENLNDAIDAAGPRECGCVHDLLQRGAGKAGGQRLS